MFMKDFGVWLQDPPYWDSHAVEDRLRRYDGKGIKKIVDGWYVREIINSGNERWKNRYDTTIVGEADRVALYWATDGVIKWILKLVEDVKGLESWAHTGQFKTAKKEANTSYTLMRAIRTWKHQELCLLRAELFDRHRLTVPELISRYEESRFHWQTCWFRQQILDRKVSKRFRQCLTQQPFEEFSDTDEYSSDGSAWSL